MRAVFINQDLHENTLIQINIEKAHHLINVVRLKKSETILLMNGKGSTSIGTILEITKKVVEIKLTEVRIFKRKCIIDLAIVLPKKEAFEDILRIATELGIRKVYPLVGANTPMDYETNNERINRILESSLEQSNNPFILEIDKKRSLNEFIISKHQYAQSFIFDVSGEGPGHLKTFTGDCLFLIGPEGGLAAHEVEKLKLNFNHTVSFGTPILRAPQAVSFGAGLLTTLLAN